MSETNSRSTRRWVGPLLTVAACGVLLGGAGLIVWWINSTEPRAQRSGATRQSAALVEVEVVERSDYRPRLTVLGRVRPAREVTLSPRVGGAVVEVADDLLPGGRVEAGQVLLRIDPAEYEAERAMRQSELRQARADLALEEGRQRVARQDFELLRDSVEADQRSLALREPQLESARAQVESAEAMLRQAELDLEQIDVKAPFAAQVMSREVDLGSRVSPGEALVQLVGVERYWVIASVPTGQLQWVAFGEGGDGGSAVEIASPGRWPEGQTRRGQVDRLIGTVDEQTRLARVLITVPDPLGEGPRLILDTIVEATIEGRPIPDVFRLDRQNLRAGQTVWVNHNDQLEVHPVEVVFSDDQYVYVRGKLETGDRVVTTNLSRPRPGTLLKEMAPPSEATPSADPPSVNPPASTDPAAPSSPATSEAPASSEGLASSGARISWLVCLAGRRSLVVGGLS